MSEPVIDIPGAEKSPTEQEVTSQALMALSNAVSQPIQVSAEQAKVNAIADLTHSAYAKASTLTLTPDEQKALQADFPDDAFKPGAAGKEHLIYIEHAYLRDRFNQVLGPGQWSLIPRSRWAEDFTYEKNGRTMSASRVYVEAMLLIRGCFVSEAVGDMVYYKNNEGQNYGDAVEGAKTAAFRRCAKELGVGLQAWKKDFGDGWWTRHRGGRDFSKSRTSQNAPGRAGTTQGVSTQPPKAQSHAQPIGPTTSKPQFHPATPETRLKLIESLGDLREVALEYFRKLDNPSALMPNEGLEQLPLAFVPITQKQWELLKAAILDFSDGEEARVAFPPNWDSAQPTKPIPTQNIHPLPKDQTGQTVSAADKPCPPPSKPVEVPRDQNQATPEAAEEWRTFPMPWGKKSGVPLEDLDKKYLFGLWTNYTVEIEYQGKPKKPETIAKDTKFREMLDQAGEYYKFEKKD